MLKALGGLLLFAAGTVVGWAVTGKFDATWVSAVGTWAGAVGTIAAILWAVHTFQTETRQRTEDLVREREDERHAQQLEAQKVTVSVFGGGGYGAEGEKTMTSVNVEFLNGTNKSISITEFRLPGVMLVEGREQRQFVSAIAPHAQPRYLVNIEPRRASDDQFSGRPFKLSTPVIRYQIDDITWERTGQDPPIRVLE
ncbi:hypothetical protein MARA_02920 (plasmid) [Mycolicibacterium arabiense]|uniref:Uncharacterized protein n=1 Tax=Mycolicibacterium arabiense TaxID=1286181 RepID=A0A7I7RQM4_9MYCO|nr:hypothetical protein [Mycolicibacterium arabiense]MCV7372127.1 hypothetical protein [Mycolicibacterium arabiense]BBY46862.1 hypothetical protein MARA_02920 [Mycolicibacterium arabiense]